jgi:tol-pal system protein YbgF
MPRRIPSFLLLAILIGATLTVPAGAANREHQQMMADIRMLQEQTQQLQLALGDLGAALKAVTAKLDQQAGVSQKSFADQKLQSDTIGGDLRVIREKVDENNVRIGSLSQEIEALRLAIPQTPMQPAAPPFGDPSNPAGQAAPPVAPAAPPSPQIGSPTRAYDTAQGDYAAGQYSLAIQGFEAYIKSFPQSPLAGNAQYYVGESYRQDGKFQDAVAAYDKVIANYPGNPVVAEAYYKRGLAYQSLGDVARARESYEHVVKSYPPDNQAAILARQALDRLKGKGLIS